RDCLPLRPHGERHRGHARTARADRAWVVAHHVQRRTDFRSARMRRMRRRSALIGVILGLVGCATDGTAPYAPTSTGPAQPSSVVPIAPQIWLAAVKRALLVGTSFVLEGCALPTNGIPEHIATGLASIPSMQYRPCDRSV